MGDITISRKDIARLKVLKLINAKYAGFGPTFLREKLIENHNIYLSKETLRQIMIINGLQDTKRRKRLVFTSNVSVGLLKILTSTHI